MQKLESNELCKAPKHAEETAAAKPPPSLPVTTCDKNRFTLFINIKGSFVHLQHYQSQYWLFY